MMTRVPSALVTNCVPSGKVLTTAPSGRVKVPCRFFEAALLVGGHIAFCLGRCGVLNVWCGLHWRRNGRWPPNSGFSSLLRRTLFILRRLLLCLCGCFVAGSALLSRLVLVCGFTRHISSLVIRGRSRRWRGNGWARRATWLDNGRTRLRRTAPMLIGIERAESGAEKNYRRGGNCPGNKTLSCCCCRRVRNCGLAFLPRCHLLRPGSCDCSLRAWKQDCVRLASGNNRLSPAT